MNLRGSTLLSSGSSPPNFGRW